MINSVDPATAEVLYYIDLGTSSYATQIAIAVLLGGLATVGVFWRRIVSRFRRGKDKNS